MLISSMVTFDLEKTRKGFPAFWEKGGGCRNTGEAYIVADANGKAKRAVYIRRRGHLANEHHALIIVEPGDYIIIADHHREDFTVAVWQIEDIVEKDTGKLVALCRQKYFFDRGEWIEDLPDYLEAAVDAAAQKALCYHCREPHHVIL